MAKQTLGNWILTKGRESMLVQCLTPANSIRGLLPYGPAARFKKRFYQVLLTHRELGPLPQSCAT
ncbi:MAG: hypothetical protein DWI28_02545 [Planctomycetota bacterium]|nr:MAG: hypothetical protein DWI28_02545 [Planctomycetota bacterium]